jgi:hypothetical protein
MKNNKFNANLQVSSDHYTGKLAKGSWMNFFYQINNTLELKPKKIVIIGVGNGTVESYLKKEGFEVITFDIDKNLNPDIIGSVTELEKYFSNNQFDVIICAHVLEHIPFKYFSDTLRQISSIGRYLILQLPPSTLQFRLNLALQPYFFNWNFNINMPILFWKKYKFNGQHYWQPYSKNHSMKKVKMEIKKYFILKKSYQCPENHYSYNFILKSKKL